MDGLKKYTEEQSARLEALLDQLPEQSDMEELVGLIGAILIRYGIRGADLMTFNDELRQYLAAMHPKIDAKMAEIREGMN